MRVAPGSEQTLQLVSCDTVDTHHLLVGEVEREGNEIATFFRGPMVLGTYCESISHDILLRSVEEFAAFRTSIPCADATRIAYIWSNLTVHARNIRRLLKVFVAERARTKFALPKARFTVTLVTHKMAL